jgi:hypothetical protein
MIEIPGYTPLVPNNVYTSEQFLSMKDGLVPVTIGISFSRFDIPTESQVFQKIQETARANNGGLYIPDGTEVTGNPLEQAIKRFPPPLVSQLASRQEGVYEFLSNKTPLVDYEGEAPRRVIATYAVLPQELVKDTQKERQDNPTTWFSSAVKRITEKGMEIGYGKRFHLQFSTIDDDLPPYDDVKTLVRLGAPISKIIAIEGNMSSPDLPTFLDVVYTALEDIALAELPDKSENVLLQYSLQPLEALRMQLERQAISQAISRGQPPGQRH